MLKLIFTFLLCLFALTIFYSSKVESRLVPLDDQDDPTSLIRFRLGQRAHPMNNQNHNDDENDELVYSKRKSEFLSSLYGLPYALVGKRNKS